MYPPRVETESPVLPEAETAFRDILSWCSEHSLPLLLTSTPYYALEDDIAQINTLTRIAEEYGVTLLNLNTPQCWVDMGLDPTTDFVDLYHVNIFGAEKFTDYLLNYIQGIYDLDDHRGEEDYSSWDDAYTNYLTRLDMMQPHTKSVAERIECSARNENTMRQSEDLTEWFPLMENQDMTFLIAASGLADPADASQFKFILNNLGLGETAANGSEILVGKNSYEGMYVDTASPDYTGGLVLPSQTVIPYTISAGPVSSITFGDKVYSYESDGIHLIAIDRYSGCVFDSVTISVEGDDICLTHEPLV